MVLKLLNKLPFIRKRRHKSCASRVDETGEMCPDLAWFGSRYCGRHQGTVSLVLRLLASLLIAVISFFAKEMKEHLWPSEQTKAFAEWRKLTNTTLVVKGMATGGNSYVEPTFSAPLDDLTNTLNVGIVVSGDYPLRGLTVKVTDETKRINSRFEKQFVSSNPLPSAVVFERMLGDVGIGAAGDLCSITLDPSVTNWFRVDFHAMNGSSWEIIKLQQVTNSWSATLHYRFRKFGGLVVIEPTNWHNALMVY